jgi:endonuclease/exonuclease/phosphatase (EEP) superfamily protein YafD
MASFLFWNLNKKPIHNAVSRLAHHYDVDVVLLAECAVSPSLLLKALNQDKLASYHYAPGIGCKRIEVFTRFISEYVRPVFEDNRWTIRHLNLPGLADILLGVVHLPSKLYFDESDQKAMCVRLANDLSMIKQQIGHANVVLAGDFNMNPFEDGMVAADGLHGMMSQSITLQESRIIQGSNSHD